MVPINYKNEIFYIHFDTAEQLEEFLSESKMHIGNKCCMGKGAHLLGVTSYKTIKILKTLFKDKERSVNTHDLECPVCMENITCNKLFIMNCTHIICTSCATSIINTNYVNNSCPICRALF